VSVLLPADLQAQTRQRWSADVDLWLTDLPGDTQAGDLRQAPLEPAELDLDHCWLSLCTSGSSGEPKRIEKTLRQLSNEVQALEKLWGGDLGPACVIGSVAAQHIYGLLFRVLWPLCAGRTFVRRQLPFPEDMQRASREHPAFAWVASPGCFPPAAPCRPRRPGVSNSAWDSGRRKFSAARKPVASPGARAATCGNPSPTSS
jgi:hypothetical protein